MAVQPVKILKGVITTELVDKMAVQPVKILKGVITTELVDKMAVQPVKILKGVITTELVDKAFTKIKSDPRNGVEGGYLELIKENRYKDVMDFYLDNYFPDEPISKSLNLRWDDDMQNMLIGILKDNMSIALVSSATGKILGVLCLNIANKYEKIDTSKYKSEALRQYVNFIYHFDNLHNIYDHYNVEDVVYLSHFAVAKDLRQKGIGTVLGKAAVALVEACGVGPVVIRAEVSSNFSKQIVEKFGFHYLAEIVFADYKVDGKVVVANSGKHKSTKLCAKL